MVFCHGCGKKKEVFGHKFCGFCGVKFAEIGTVASNGSSTVGGSVATRKCICEDCFLQCDMDCQACYPPKKMREIDDY